MTTTEERRWTLEKFAAHPFYQDVNRRLVALTELHSGQRVVDLGSGSGAVTRLLAEEVGVDGEVIAVDPSEDAIETATRNVADVDGAPVRFVQASAEDLGSLVHDPVDAVFFCNAIHLVPDKNQVLREVRRTLKQEGTFSFNTTFYQGAEPEESALFYRKWMIKSLRALKGAYGLSPDKTKVEARHRLTQEDYVTLLKDNGFVVRQVEVMGVELPLTSFEGISEYSLWIEGVLPGVPYEAGAASLKQGAREAFEELELTSSPRNWLLVVASRA